MFCHPIGRRADLIKQPRRRGGVEQIATPARPHQRHQMPRCADMAHQVDLPNALPLGIRDFDAALDRDTGVGAEKINRPDVTFDRGDQRDDLRLARDIDAKGRAADLSRRRLGPRAVDVYTDDMRRRLLGKAQRQGPPDAAGGPGDDDDAARELHISCRCQSRARSTPERPSPRPGRSPDGALHPAHRQSAARAATCTCPKAGSTGSSPSPHAPAWRRR